MKTKINPDEIDEEYKFLISYDSNGEAYMDTKDVEALGVIIMKMKVEKLKNSFARFKNGLFKKSTKNNEDI